MGTAQRRKPENKPAGCALFEISLRKRQEIPLAATAASGDLERSRLILSELDALPGQAVDVQVGHEGVRIVLLDVPDPGLFQLPASICLAPIMAGTPVV